MKHAWSFALMAATVSLALVLSLPAPAQAAPTSAPKPTTPIKHIIVLMQEGHSFDNYFGTYPGANGLPPNVCMPSTSGDATKPACVKPFALRDRSLEWVNNTSDLFQAQYNQGAMDGFVAALQRRNHDGAAVMGYYDDVELPYYWNIADDYVLFDHFFSSAAGGTVANRMFWLSATPGSDQNHIPAAGYGALPTIFDALEASGVSWKFYVQNYDPAQTYRALQPNGRIAPQVERAPLLAFARFVDDPKLASHIVDLDQYYEDLRNGTLPAVAYVASANAREESPSRPNVGQRLARGMINALMQSDAWSSSAFLITYDSSGGWYDHVAPPQVDRYGYGFRVPAMLVSPYARRGYVDSTQLDFTSILKFIETNYGLAPLSTRDAQANSISAAFAFTLAPRPARFLATEREATRLPEPRRDLIYTCYSAAIVLAGLIMAGAATRASSRRGSAALPPAAQDGVV